MTEISNVSLLLPYFTIVDVSMILIFRHPVIHSFQDPC